MIAVLAPGRHEGVRASVIAGVDAPPVLQSGEHGLDPVALAVERLVVLDLDLAIGLRRDAGRDPSFDQGLAEPVGVVAFVAEQRLGLREGVDHQGRTLVIAHLALAEQHDQRAAAAIADGVQFGVQAALGAPDTSGKSPFLSRLAAVL